MTNLCDTFCEIASGTWTNLRLSRERGRASLEEAITDENLLTLQVRHPSAVLSHTMRGGAGAAGDWEWWFTGPSGKWFGCRVRTMILNMRTARFEHLHYAEQGQEYPSDALIRRCTAHSHAPVPLYLAYAHWDVPQAIQARYSALLGQAPETYGCSLIPAYQVRQLRTQPDADTLAAVQPYLVPWHLLVCSRQSNEDLPHRAYRIWNRVLRPAGPPSGSRAPMETQPAWPAELHARPPAYVSGLRAGETIAIDDAGLHRVTIFIETA